MRIACVGGGPAGLYFAISMKLRDASHEIEVFERNPPGVTFGWGVVFSDQTVENLQANDPQSAKVIADDHLRRARIHRDRPQAPARDTPDQSARARRCAAFRG
jgi:2-polyprenyl-6-methoxyphenol hydroxylase-like FAD-dependent oxidoreductase